MEYRICSIETVNVHQSELLQEQGYSDYEGFTVIRVTQKCSNHAYTNNTTMINNAERYIMTYTQLLKYSFMEALTVIGNMCISVLKMTV